MRARLAALLAAMALASLASTSTAAAQAPHVVAPGETLWSIAAANGLTTRTVAVFNGIAEDTQLQAGATIEVPTVDEGAAALASAGYTTSTSTATTSTTSSTATSTAPAPPVPTPWLSPIWSPWGTLYLASGAAESWNAMREASLAQYGVDLYPNGTMSAYRSYDQQSYLYNLYLSGQGALANPPGTSSHELGTAVDVATPEMRWVIDQIGYAYGWGKVHAPTEWWHVDYLG
jgi:LAS superfamily LD-carboxypeptidase LdcB